LDRIPADGQGEDPASAGSELLLSQVYDELRALAAQQLRREKAGHTLQPTALVNEAYLRLAKVNPDITDREQFLALGARAMRRVLVDHARKRSAARRGGGELKRITLDEALTPAQGPEIDLVVLNDLLEKLAQQDARMCQIVELRFFGGLSVDEIAKVLGISDRTVDRDWFVAKAWLARGLSESLDA
jgi:RNA polymerase sigma factor (TIGR02999 family)